MRGAAAIRTSLPIMTNRPVSLSILDLVPITVGGSAAQSFRNSVDLAQHAERWGYKRYWIAEHHNIAGVASAATSLVIAHLAAATSTMRIGAGGIMLPNHAPLVIAEQFGTLEALYPGRIDLGLGRAPGSDMNTARALRRNLGSSGDTFPEDVRELQGYLAPSTPGQPVRAVPGEGSQVPLYILGSSDFGARMAAQLGLPFAFASHFAPAYLRPALELYRSNFRPSEFLDRPHAMVGVNVFAADTEAEAFRLFTSLQQAFRNLVRNTPGPLPPPVDSMDGLWSPAEEANAERMTAFSIVGSPEGVRSGLDRVLEITEADEIIATAQIYDHAARLKSFEILAEVFRERTFALQSS